MLLLALLYRHDFRTNYGTRADSSRTISIGYDDCCLRLRQSSQSTTSTTMTGIANLPNA